MEIEIFGGADADQAAAVAAQALLGLLVQGKDAPRVGQQNLALLRQPDTTRIAYDQA